MSLVPRLPWSHVPYHAYGALARAAEAASFALVEQRDVTDRVAPTYTRLSRALQESRTDIARRFARRPAIEQEIIELLVQVQNMREAFANGDLRYEISVFRRPAVETREGTRV